MKVLRAPKPFIQALYKRPISCLTLQCSGPVTIEDLSRSTDCVKTFRFRCKQCDWEDIIGGNLQRNPPWNEGALMEITEQHLLHLEPVCPYDQAPVDFHSLPNPRRRARYRISCFFCGRQEELDWPPEEAKR